MPKPNITYDEDAQALYVKLRTARIDHTEDLGQVAIDIGVNGEVVGVEIIYRSE